MREGSLSFFRLGTPLCGERLSCDFKGLEKSSPISHNLKRRWGPSMISDEKIFDFVSKRVEQTSADTEAGLKLFLPMYSAVLGGSIWLSDKLGSSIPAKYEYLSDSLISLLTLVCVYIVIDNLRAWWGYRVQLSKLTSGSDHQIANPTRRAAFMEVVLCAAMLGACVMFILFNPLTASGH
jgi:hypothetical protein